MIDERTNRSCIYSTSLYEAEADDVDYWMRKTPAERIEVLEYRRRWVYGDDQIDAPIQRVLMTHAHPEDPDD